ncbi:prepilin-type N-terminal cleavage/methylation domain-containing protein [Candidatus Thioglobus sp.]|nr:prepilin-type N-terminal cleavage/methylation domain-containing protein [Candidatus Thioglobus sp.]
MRHNKKAFTLVEMLVALAVSAVIVSATYASFELIKNQYKKNIDVTQLHTSGRAIMQVLEREIRMAGYEFRDDKGLMTYGKIMGPLVITDSGNKCCDEVTIIYDEVTDTLNAQGVVTSSIVDRIKTRFWTEAHSSSKRGSRFRLYKRRTVLGTNNAVLATPRVGAKEVMADYIEDLQLINTSGKEFLYAVSGSPSMVHKYDTTSYTWDSSFGVGQYSHIGAIDIGPDGQLYSVTQSGKTSIQVVNLDTQSYSYIDSPGRNSRFCPGLGFGSDGNLYVNAGCGEVDVYDISTKQLLRTETNPSSSITNLTNGRIDVSASGQICQVPWGQSQITCTNPTMSMGRAGPYKIVRSDSQGRIYATRDSTRSDIDVFNVSTGAYIDSIKLGINGQSRSSHTHGLANLSNIKKLSTVNIVLSLRTKEKYGGNRQVDKKDYHSGNFIFSKNDPYQRDTFSTSVSVRNL